MARTYSAGAPGDASIARRGGDRAARRDAARRYRALVYGDVDLNLIDGSAVWAQSTVQALARAGCEVTIVLKTPVQTDRLTGPLIAEPGVTVLTPHDEGLTDRPLRNALTPLEATAVLVELDRRQPYDLIVIRGRRVASQVAADGRLSPKLWTYLTDIPQSVLDLTAATADELSEIAEASRFILCQTEELRCFLESSVPAACGKCVLMTPIVPPVPDAPDVAGAAGGEDPPASPAVPAPVRLVYTGKFAPLWNTLEMTRLPALLATRGVRAEMHMLGDKIHNDPADPTFRRRMRDALGDPVTPPAPGQPMTGQAAATAGERDGGVIWYGGQSRADAMRIAAACHIGLSWRHPDMDASLELSTKVLEFGALGLPVVLNRTPMHEELLGADYPLFVTDGDDVADVIERLAGDPAVFRLAAARTGAAAAGFTLDRAAEQLRAHLRRAFPGEQGSGGQGCGAPARADQGPGAPAPGEQGPGGPGAAEPGPRRRLRVVVAGHDLKFFGRILEYLRGLPELEVRTDQWAALARHDSRESAGLARWADVVICEWCGPNAIWYSRRKRRGTRLLVRLHRFELYSPYIRQLDVKAVDQLVCVSPQYARLTRERTGWPAEKVITIPNWVDTTQLDRPKLEGARFHLGLIGAVPSRKRIDLALDVLDELRRDDDRFTLSIKTTMPWDHWWIWKKEEERDHYITALRRIQRSPALRDAVIFDKAGPDVAAWLRRIGFVLSTSDDESFHVAPAEGMASRAVPVIRDWPGAQTIYQRAWIHRTPGDMSAAIAGLSSADWRDAGERARAQAAEAFGLERVCASWRDLLTADLPPAVPDPLELLGTV